MIRRIIEEQISLSDSRYQDELAQERVSRSTVVLCSAFSPDGLNFVCGSKDGRLAIWTMSKCIALQDPTPSKADVSFVGHQGAVYTVLFLSPTLFVTGGDDGVFGWDLSTCLSSTSTKPCSPKFSLSPQSNKGLFGRNGEVNQLCTHQGMLMSGTGSGEVLGWDMQTLQPVHTYQAHCGTVHCVCDLGTRGLSSGGEDGLLAIWDVRTNSRCATLDTQTGEATTQLNRKRRGDGWISGIVKDSQADWMAVGGGADGTIGLWHLDTLSLLRTMPTASTVQAVLMDQDDQLISSGNDATIRYWSKARGQQVCGAKTSSPSILTLATNNKVLCAAGVSSTIDCFIDRDTPGFQLCFA